MWGQRNACNRVLGQELSEAEEAVNEDLVRAAEEKELDAWKSFAVFEPIKAGDLGKSAADTRWVLAWKTVEGVQTAKTRKVAKGFQDPDLKGGRC